MTGQRTLPGLGLSAYWTSGSSGWDTQHDPDTRMLSALVQAHAKSRTTTLPGSPTDGDIYVVKVGDTDANKVAVRDNGAWVYFTPVEGWLIYIQDDDKFCFYTGAAWSELSTGGGGGGLPSFTGNAGKVLAVNDDEDDAEWIDVPAELPSLTGNADKVLAVKTDESGAEWVDAGGGGDTAIKSDQWRIKIHSNNGGPNFAFGELQMYETLGGPNVALATNGTVAATVSDSFGSASNLNDGVLNQNWGTTTTDGNWAKMTFTSPVDINVIGLSAISDGSVSATDAPKIWDVEYWDGAAWVLKWSVDSTGFWDTGATGQLRLFPSPSLSPTGRHWRTTSDTITAADADGFICGVNASAQTATIPADTTLFLPLFTTITWMQSGAGQIEVVGASGVTLVLPTGAAAKTLDQNMAISAIKTAPNKWTMVGALGT